MTGLSGCGALAAFFKGKGDNLLVVVAQDDPLKHLVPDMEIHVGRSNTKSVRLELDCTECGHCFDMMAPKPGDPDQLVSARSKILAQLQEWTL